MTDLRTALQLTLDALTCAGSNDECTSLERCAIEAARSALAATTAGDASHASRLIKSGIPFRLGLIRNATDRGAVDVNCDAIMEMLALIEADLAAPTAPAVPWTAAEKKHVMRVYDKMHKGKLGAHWLWVVCEQIAAGIPEDQVMSDFGYYVKGRPADVRDAALLPKSYGGSTFSKWGNQHAGCTVGFHFTDQAEARAWVDALLSGRASKEG